MSRPRGRSSLALAEASAARVPADPCSHADVVCEDAERSKEVAPSPKRLAVQQASELGEHVNRLGDSMEVLKESFSCAIQSEQEKKRMEQVGTKYRLP